MQLVDHLMFICYNKVMIIDSEFINGVSTRYRSLDQLPNVQARIEDAQTLRTMGCNVIHMFAMAGLPEPRELKHDMNKVTETNRTFVGPLVIPMPSEGEDTYYVPKIAYAVWEKPENSGF